MVLGKTYQARAYVVAALNDHSAVQHQGTIAVRDNHRFDESRLSAWMKAHVEGFRGPLTVRQFEGGQSNPTYKLLTPHGAYVMRRKPPGPLLKGAHAVDREALVLQALQRANFPVAHCHALCLDDAVIGTSFYIMAFVEGRIFWDAALAEVSSSERPAYFDAMNATIARLHGIDYRAVGLADFGRAGNYFERQIARWSKQYAQDEAAGRDANMDSLVEWLPAHIPPGDETSLVHGDFRVDNVAFHPTEPKIVAVLDWELSTLGHPLADFTYHSMMYHMPPHIVAGLAGTDPASCNIPTEEAYLEAYCSRTGRKSIPAYSFYLAFNFFRIAAIFHGIRGRVMRGTAASAQSAERARNFPELARLARRFMEDCR